MNNNRGGNNRRRGRGNNRPQGGGQQLNRIDSRARGNAPQMLEKYRKLAHDAHLNGDRVNAEYYLQFADHYFRVIADTRLRQEEARLRRDDRWQDNGEFDRDEGDEGGDFDNDFPSFDQPPSYARREREDRGERQEDRPPREEQGNRLAEAPRGEPQGRFQDNRGERARHENVRAGNAATADNAEDAAPQRSIYEPEENPFLRENRSRGLRPRREDRRPRREEHGEDTAERAGDDSSVERAVTAGIDPDSLPPAFTTARVEPVAEAVAEPAPRRRTRRKPAAGDAGESVESVN
ncbi:MAG: DUF4167 domain-containing protein [Sphingomonadales bacterium]|nr:DUF4167 domain-containing protein [Sphingomonadales bacterium]